MAVTKLANFSGMGFMPHQAGLCYNAEGKVTDTTSGIEVESVLLDPDDPIPPTAPDGPGIFPTNPSQKPIPGDTYKFKVFTETPYYWVDVYVKTPWDTSEKGTQIGDGVHGDGTSTNSVFEYTFPTSGTTDATGDYKITAEIWQWSDMSESTVNSTVTVYPPWLTEHQ